MNYSIIYLDTNGDVIRSTVVDAKPAVARLDLGDAASLFVLNDHGVRGFKGCIRSLLACNVFATLCGNDINNVIASIAANL